MRSAHKRARYAVGALLAVTAVAAAACSSSSSSSSAPASTPASGTSGASASGSAAAPATVTNVTLGYVPYSDDASLFYAQDSGIFKQHGLNVNFVAQASPVAVEASMASGTEQFGFITTPARFHWPACSNCSASLEYSPCGLQSLSRCRVWTHRR
jgi:ABC-type nitrate/sulfonate/bicarbonate transport system substrate-binding protein